MAVAFQNILQNFRIMLKKGYFHRGALSSLKGVATFTLIGANSMQTQRKQELTKEESTFGKRRESYSTIKGFFEGTLKVQAPLLHLHAD